MSGIEPIPMEWVDNLFVCMEQFYGERWLRYYDHPYKKDAYKTMWKNGLHGLTYDQIKRQLKRYKKVAENKKELPPIVTEFYRYAKID